MQPMLCRLERLLSWLMTFLMFLLRYGFGTLHAHSILPFPLQLAKILKYVNQEQPSQYIFLVFGFLFFVTRMIIYPFYLIKSVILEYPVIHSHAPAWWITLILLLLLLVKIFTICPLFLCTRLSFADHAYLLVLLDRRDDCVLFKGSHIRKGYQK